MRWSGLGRRAHGVLAGGVALDGDGYYVAPTIVELDDAAAELAQDEVFAPVCALLVADSADAAVAISNGVRYGLATSVFTRDLDRALDLADRIDTGSGARQPADLRGRSARAVRRREGVRTGPPRAGQSRARVLHVVAHDLDRAVGLAVSVATRCVIG